MNAAMPVPYVESQTESIRNFARESVTRWSELCQQFLDHRPTSEQMPDHLNTLKWLLRFARALHLTAADPEYPDRQIANELEGRLIQLEHYWLMLNNPMPESEADKLASEIFA
jgi:hypothetical protein